MTNALEVRDVGHAYLGRKAIQNIDLFVPQGTIVAIVGPSGCGKSTLVHIAADVIDTLFGTIKRNYKRHAMVFQEPRLMGWATAEQNIALPLKLAHIPKKFRRSLIAEAAEQVSLLPEDLLKFPSELSGGMRQRVAIARALILKPDFIFFDEPFTALDVALKRRMQDLVLNAQKQLGLSGLFITHDLMEAARISHQVAVMNSDGNGMRGLRAVPGEPGERRDEELFELAQHWKLEDKLFAHIHDVDERKTA